MKVTILNHNIMKVTDQIDRIENQELESNKAKKMIQKHKKHMKNLKPYPVPNDPCRTVFYASTKEKGLKAVENHIKNHKNFWI